MRVGVIAMPLPWPKPTTSPSTIATVTTRTTLRDTALMSSAARAGMATERLARTRASSAIRREIGRAHVCTPVTNAHIVCRLLLEKNKFLHLYFYLFRSLLDIFCYVLPPYC